jgi:hypothetical protein
MLEPKHPDTRSTSLSGLEVRRKTKNEMAGMPCLYWAASSNSKQCSKRLSLLNLEGVKVRMYSMTGSWTLSFSQDDAHQKIKHEAAMCTIP